MRLSDLAVGQRTVTVNGEGFIWDRAGNLDSLIIRDPPGDALSLASGCSGRLGYLEITTSAQDGIKVQNAGTPAHDWTVESGILRAVGKQDGAHQDGIQVMGGARLQFNRLSILGFDTQGVFINRGGSGATTPTDITVDGCWVGPTGATAVNVNNAVRTVVTNCHIWRTARFGRGLVGVPVGNNTIHQASDPFPPGVPGGVTPPPPDPDPDPDPCAALRTEVAQLRAELDACGANEGTLLAEIGRLTGLLAQIETLANGR